MIMTLPSGAAPVLINMSLIGLAGLGTRFNDEFMGTANSGSSFRTVSLLSLDSPISWLVFGVDPYEDNDKFKFKALTFVLPEEDTPEPGTLALLAIGAALLAARRKRA